MAEPHLEFCLEILPLVSRTFAINIRVLKGELRDAVLTAYLFCRIVDTVEDSENLDLELRNNLLQTYRALFDGQAVDAAGAESWVKRWDCLDPANPEHRLIDGLPHVIALYNAFPPNVRHSIAACVMEMAEGMELTVAGKLGTGNNPHGLKTLNDLYQYCHYVAGTVGKMLTDLFIHHSPQIDQRVTRRLYELSPAFARGLQMTNIIKDCSTDFQRGWCYIPESMMHGLVPSTFFDPTNQPKATQVLNELVLLTADNLDQALEYTLLLPRSEARMRLFNLWSLFFAIKTLSRCYNNPALVTGQFKVKISRREVYITLAQTVIRVRSDSSLRRLYARYRRAIPK